ncbi:MAG: septation protein IspZ [Oligoflexia bacterium]|nr:septation protein IspZ [Oligoflexia bacterium]
MTRPPTSKKQALRALVLGGLLPVVAFTVIEESYGIVWGVVAGMVFGVGEIAWERLKVGRVSPVTYGGNGMILVLGGVSLLTQEGIWFKLQPALIEALMALALWGSVLAGRPLMSLMAEKQLPAHAAPAAVARFRSLMGGMTVRFGAFFGAHASLATWAAFEWSTRAWGLLKGVGFTVSFLVYVLAEGLLLRYRIASK